MRYKCNWNLEDRESLPSSATANINLANKRGGLDVALYW